MWATHYIALLKGGHTVSFRPKGNSMRPKIESGQLVTVVPLPDGRPAKGDIVLCTVRGKQYLHLVSAVGQDGRLQISNNRGHVNGWVSRESVHGLLTRVEPAMSTT